MKDTPGINYNHVILEKPVRGRYARFCSSAASFIMPLQIGKTPIVVPRQHQFNEHVNDHQVEFARNVAQRMGTIIPVEDIETLGDIITNYDQIVAGMGHGMSSNNAKFNEELEKLVDELY